MHTRAVSAVALALMSTIALADTAAQRNHDEGVAAGRAGNTAARSFVNDTAAKTVVPGYTTAPPETAFARQPLSQTQSAGRTRTQQCQAAGNQGDAACQGTDTAYRSAMTPHERVNANDPAVAQASAVRENPQAQVSLSGTYSACTTRSTVTGKALSDAQSCYTYYRRRLDIPCDKILAVQIDWVCPTGTTGPVATTRPDGSVTQECTRTTQITGQPDKVETVAAAPTEADVWANGCATYEARVPPGLLPPDGENNPKAAAQ